MGEGRQMQFIDLKTQFERIEPDVLARVEKVIRSQRYIMGPEIEELEQKLADFAGIKHCLTCGSGTDALVISLMSIGLEKTDAVFVPAFTFFASGESVTLAGGTPVFVDSGMDFNISTTDLERAIEQTEAEGKLKPRGIIAVDLFGQTADFDEVQRIADEHGLFVLEDAAQGFGATNKGRRAGSFGNIAATSFFPAKPLGCYGDGGAIFTDDDKLAALAGSVRVHGQGKDKYDNVRIGINGRFDTIQAAVVLAKLEIFEDEIVERNRVAEMYSERLSEYIQTPQVHDGNVSVWAQYTLVAESEQQKEAIQSALSEAEIPSANYYPIPMHLSTAYAGLGYHEGDLPVCEKLSKCVFSIPMHAYLDEPTIDRICNVIKGAI